VALIDNAIVDPFVILGGLIGRDRVGLDHVVRRIPTSSSHALMGGLWRRRGGEGGHQRGSYCRAG